MKIRQGFISNSSTSSFIVPNRNWIYDKKKSFKNYFLNKSKRKKVLAMGFIETACISPYALQRNPNQKSINPASKKDSCFGMVVSCNQDDIIYALLKEKIPFNASCHYGHYNVLYDPSKWEDYFWVFQNFGLHVEMYDFQGPSEFSMGTEEMKGIEKKSRKKYLKEQKKWVDDIEDIEPETILTPKRKGK